MSLKPGIREAVWMAVGAAVFAGFIALVAHFRPGVDLAAQAAARAARMESVTKMRLGVAAASEAGKGAVMAVTDPEARAFAEQARTAATGVEWEERAMGELLKKGGTVGERDLLGQFAGGFAEFQKIDGELLDMAVKGTNLKAYSLAFGPGAKAVEEMNAALSRVAAANGGSPEAVRVVTLALGAQTAVLRIQALLAPHIAEESDKKMDEMEAVMSGDEAKVRAGLDGLAAVAKPGGEADLAAAEAGYAKFEKIKAEILILSRQNTNVRSLSVALNQRRKAAAACQETLDALRQAIEAEPTAGVKYEGGARGKF